MIRAENKKAAGMTVMVAGGMGCQQGNAIILFCGTYGGQFAPIAPLGFQTILNSLMTVPA